MAHLHKIGPTQNFWFRQASTTHLALQVKLLQFFGPRLNSWTQGCSCSIWGWTVDYWTLLYKHCRTIFSHSSTLTTFKLGRVGFSTGQMMQPPLLVARKGGQFDFPPWPWGWECKLDSSTPPQNSPWILLAPKYDPPKKVKLRHPPHRPEDHRGGYQTSSSWFRPKCPGFGFVQLMKMWEQKKCSTNLPPWWPHKVTEFAEFVPCSNLFLHIWSQLTYKRPRWTMPKALVHWDSRASEAKVQKILPQSGLTLRSSVHITRTFICGDAVALCSGLVLVVLCLGFCDSATVS